MRRPIVSSRAPRLRLPPLVAALAATAWAASPASAQVDIEVPTVVFDSSATDSGPSDDEELDLANIVQSAAKGITTVQEAPAIVTVVTSDEIAARGYQNFEQLIDGVPGWMRLGGVHGQFPFPMTRGIIQSSLFMHNGMSLFDSFFNVPQMWRIQPLETIKRVELVTGPGGVLWGANSFLGVINVITKDAEDVDGIEAGVSVADGNGDRQSLRGYVMAGIPELFSDNSKLFVHAAFETFKGPGLEMAAHMFSAPLPQPNSITYYGPLTRADPPRSLAFNADGKLTVGALSVYFQVPFAKRHTALGFAGFVSREEWQEDTFELPDGELACPYMPGLSNEEYLDPNDDCLDLGHKARNNELDWFDRYVMGEYRTRLADGKAGITIKGYGIQFYRDFAQVGVLSAVPGLLEGGLAFKFVGHTYRVGTNLDGDIELPADTRLLYGLEAVRDWTPSTVERSRQGEGIEATFIAPLQLERLPVPCPREPDPDNPGGSRIMEGCPLTFAFAPSRTVLGAYVNPQWRPTKKLILDAGARLQIAPAALGEQEFDLTPIFSGSLVYNFIPDWHFKFNYTEGFRPPVFNNTNSNGEAVQIDGDLDLAVETSNSFQGEINARLFKGDRRIREVNFRADYSYTTLQNYIAIVAGRYENTADRGIHSAELLGKIYIQGGHRLELGYTFLRMNTADVGIHKSMPEHWFNLTGIFNVIDDKLQFTTNLRVTGAMEDPNRLVEYRDLGYGPDGAVIDTRTGETINFLLSKPHELVMDRLPPGAELTLGVTYTPMERLRVSAYTYNTFNERYYQPDAFFSYEPRLEFLPNPYEDFAARVNVAYDY
jgi:outer membrane receptor protein involved in Fe transport